MQEDQERSRKIEKISAWTLAGGVIFILAMGVIGFYFGNPHKASRAFDSSLMACGSDIGLEEYKYAYLVNPQEGYLGRVVCVSQCPLGTKDDKIQSIDCSPNRAVQSCKEKIDIFHPENSVMYYDTFSFIEKICVPTTFDYYDIVKDAIIPDQNGQMRNDLIVVWIWSLFLVIPALLISHYSKKLLIDFTKVIVWFLTITIFIIIAFAGIYFAVQMTSAIAFNNETAEVGSFKVSQKFINDKTNAPKVLDNALLMIISVCLTLYGGYWVYTQAWKIDYLCQILDNILEHLNNYFADVDVLVYIFIGLFVLIIGSLEVIIIHIMSIYSKKDDAASFGPFQKIEESLLGHLKWVVLFFGLWVICFLQAILEDVATRTLKEWFNDAIQTKSSQINSHYGSQINQREVNKGQIQIKLRKVFDYAVNHKEQLAHASLLFMLSPIYFAVDFVIDSINSLKKTSPKIYSYLFCRYLCLPCVQIDNYAKSIETVLYLEMNNNSIENCRTAVKQTLENEQDREIYELIRNLGAVLVLAAKFYCALMISALVYGITNNVTYFKDNLYSVYGPILLGALIGYQIASIYFIVYSVAVQGLGYLAIKNKDTLRVVSAQVSQQRQGMTEEQRKEQEATSQASVIVSLNKIIMEIYDAYRQQQQEKSE